MNAANDNAGYALDELLLRAARMDLEIECLSKLRISKTGDAIVYDVPGWGATLVPWSDVLSLVQQYGVDGALEYLIDALVDAFVGDKVLN